MKAVSDTPITPPVRNPRARSTGVAPVGGATVVVVIRVILSVPGGGRTGVGAWSVDFPGSPYF
ncbi:hypothetical protein GCM10018790_77420 [Kitasatospora xanthocidica]|nr:hypothetical protein GCM10018790_77420 [Kitasatospora xanthocidica]